MSPRLLELLGGVVADFEAQRPVLEHAFLAEHEVTAEELQGLCSLAALILRGFLACPEAHQLALLGLGATGGAVGDVAHLLLVASDELRLERAVAHTLRGEPALGGGSAAG